SLVSARMIAEGVPGLLRDRTDRPHGAAITGTLPKKLTIGGAAGMLPGLLGIGTGSILVPAFAFLLKAPVKTAVAASLVCFCFNSLISSAFKAAQGFVELDVVLPVCLGTLIGSNLGAVANKRLAPAHVKLVFGLVFTYVSFKFILSSFAVSL
ncbi:MAG: sulfite exporter TauE/SafE family protein, partial [Gemmatimonadales bacterium]